MKQSKLTRALDSRLGALTSRTSLALFASCAALLTACGPGPLPAENPKTEAEKPADPIAVSVKSTAPAPASSTNSTISDKAPTPASPTAIIVKGFQTPESVLLAADLGCYFVSNINGNPTDVDNNGFISKMSTDGDVIALKFIEGGKDGLELNAPKGMARVGNTLYVADINKLRAFDLETGKAKPALAFPNATFLNDIVVGPKDVLYVSDSGLKGAPSGLVPSGSDTIYKVNNGKATVFAKGPALSGPNGLQFAADNLWTVTFGKNQLLRFDAKGKVAATVELPGGALDGLIALSDGRFLVTSWQAKTVYIGDAQGFASLIEGVASPADIAWDESKQRVAIPLFTENEVRLVSVTLPQPVAAPETPAPAAATPEKPSQPTASGKPVEAKADAKPTTETKAADVKAAAAKPSSAKLVEGKPATEPKPSTVKAAEAKPAKAEPGPKVASPAAAASGK